MSSSKAVGAVLCAGFGTRMAPITDVIPKPLIPFLNTPLVAFALDHLSTAGIIEVGMNLHHLADALPPVVDRLAAAMKLRMKYAREWEILGSAGGVRGIWYALGEPEATLVVLNGDVVMNLDLGDCLKQHQESGRRASWVVRPRDPDQPGKVWVDEEAMALRGVRDFRHPSAAGADLKEYDYTGVAFYEPELLREIPMEVGCIIDDVLGPAMEGGEELGVLVNDDYWAALDTPGLYFEHTRRVLQEPGLLRQAPFPEPLGEDLYVFNEEGFADKARLAGPILTGAHVQVEAGAELGPWAVLDGVDVASGASIREAVLYGMGRVEGQWHRCLAVAGKVVVLPEDAE